MNLICYHRLSTRSRRAFTRLYRPRFCKYRTRLGNPRYYLYVPRGTLLERLSAELKMSKAQVLEQIKKERVWLLKQNHPYDTQWQPFEVV